MLFTLYFDGGQPALFTLPIFIVNIILMFNIFYATGMQKKGVGRYVGISIAHLLTKMLTEQLLCVLGTGAIMMSKYLWGA